MKLAHRLIRCAIIFVWWYVELVISAQWIFSVARIGAQGQPCVWIREFMNMILLQKQIKPLVVMQGLRPLFLLRCRFAPMQASANRHRRRNSLRSSGLHHSKENLENRLARCFAFRESKGNICRARPLWPQQLKIRSYIRDSNWKLHRDSLFLRFSFVAAPIFDVGESAICGWRAVRGVPLISPTTTNGKGP